MYTVFTAARCYGIELGRRGGEDGKGRVGYNMTDKARDGDREKSGERGSRRVRDREGVTERGTETASRVRQS